MLSPRGPKIFLLLSIYARTLSYVICFFVSLPDQRIKPKSSIDIRPAVMMWFNYPPGEDKIKFASKHKCVKREDHHESCE
jgi:hypothetical protein